MGAVGSIDVSEGMKSWTSDRRCYGCRMNSAEREMQWQCVVEGETVSTIAAGRVLASLDSSHCGSSDGSAGESELL